MRGLAIFLLAALLLAAAVVMLDLNLGNLTLWLPPYRIDMSLQLALFSLLIIFVGLVVLALLVIQLASIPARVKRFRLHRTQNQRLLPGPSTQTRRQAHLPGCLQFSR